MSAYFMAQIAIHDRDQYREYEEGFDRVFEGYDGRVIVVDDHPVVLEGDWQWKRLVLIRFSSQEEARRWYHSDGYQSLAKLRREVSEATILLAEGRD